MPSFKLSAALLATAIFSLNTQAQYSIDPNSVSLATRQKWCEQQIAACPLLCLQNSGSESSTTTANDCDPTTLAYDCVCGNGLAPNFSNYSLTIPYFECQEYGNQCVAGCGGQSGCEDACRADHPCGAQDPTRINATSTTSSVSSTGVPAGATSGTAGVVFTGLGGGAVATQTSASSSSETSTSSKKSGAQAALAVGHSYGLAIVFGGVFAGFALIM